MITYTVHEPPGHPDGAEARADGMIFVKEGFSWGAFLLPLFWPVYHRMWLALLGYAASVLGLIMIALAAGLDASVAGGLFFALGVVFGLEADQLRRWTLDRNGYSTVGVVSGRTREECEFRFFSSWLAEGFGGGGYNPAQHGSGPSPGLVEPVETVIGLFPSPGR